MAGQATVTIKDKQWACSVANAFAELTRGLSGVPSMPAGTGMLFDLGVDYKTIQIDMTRMLFPLDIIFINSTQGVVGVLHNVQPGENASLQNETLPGARCFLEINAAEAEGIEVGDNVDIQGYVQPTASPIDLLLGVMPYLVFLFMMMKVTDMALEAPKEKPKLPPGYVPVGTARKAPAPVIEEEELRERKLTLENKGREMAKEAGVEFVRLDEGWQVKHATTRYWFKDSRGHEIIASDLNELKWKLSILLPQTTEGGFKPGEIVIYKGERVRVSEQIGDRVNIFIPSRQELIWVKPEALEKITKEENLAPQTKPTLLPQEYVKIIAPGQTALTIGSIVSREELERENRKARERGEHPATAEVWEGGKPVMIRPKVIPTAKTKAQPDKLEYLADSPEFLTQTIADIGYREKIDNAFQGAIARAKRLK